MLVEWEKFSGCDENCPQKALDLEDSLVTSSRPPGRPQKRPDDRTSNDSIAAQAADGSQRTGGAADEQCLRCGCSSFSHTVVPCAVYGSWTHCQADNRPIFRGWRSDSTLHSYVVLVLPSVAPVWDSTAHVCSLSRFCLLEDTSRLLDIRTSQLVSVGDCSFSTAGPRLWNGLPEDVQSASSLTIFRWQLKLTCFGNRTRTLFCSCGTKVELEVILLRPL